MNLWPRIVFVETEAHCRRRLPFSAWGHILYCGLEGRDALDPSPLSSKLVPAV